MRIETKEKLSFIHNHNITIFEAVPFNGLFLITSPQMVGFKHNLKASDYKKLLESAGIEDSEKKESVDESEDFDPEARAKELSQLKRDDLLSIAREYGKGVDHLSKAQLFDFIIESETSNSEE